MWTRRKGLLGGGLLFAFGAVRWIFDGLGHLDTLVMMAKGEHVVFQMGARVLASDVVTWALFLAAIATFLWVWRNQAPPVPPSVPQEPDSLQLQATRKVLREASEYFAAKDATTPVVEGATRMLLVYQLIEEMGNHRLQADYDDFQKYTTAHGDAYSKRLADYLAKLAVTIRQEDLQPDWEPPTGFQSWYEWRK